MPSGDVRTRVWRKGTLEAENFPFEQISDYLQDDDCIVWADVCAPNSDVLAQIAEELSLNPLAVEDAMNQHERPKVARYRTHMFVSTFALRVSRDLEVEMTHVSAFMTSRALVTVRGDDGFNIDDVVKRWDDNADLLQHGKRALEHGLLDVIVDQYIDVIQVFDDQIDDLETVLFAEQGVGNQVQRRTYDLRKALQSIRRVVSPTRDLVESIMRRTVEQDANNALLPFFEDLDDHILHASEWTESLRETASSILQTNLSLADARLNNVMKKLTAWAAIVAVPTAVTGYFGQNLRFPGFNSVGGFAFSLALIVVSCVGLYVAFRRRGWL